MVLHTINKTGAAVTRCLEVLSNNDAILLLEDGVYLAQDNAVLQNMPETIKIFALSDDLSARGIANNVHENVSKVDWPGFVTLTTEYDKVVSWG